MFGGTRGDSREPPSVEGGGLVHLVLVRPRAADETAAMRAASPSASALRMSVASSVRVTQVVAEAARTAWGSSTADAGPVTALYDRTLRIRFDEKSDVGEFVEDGDIIVAVTADEDGMLQLTNASMAFDFGDAEDGDGDDGVVPPPPVPLVVPSTEPHGWGWGRSRGPRTVG